MHPDSEKEAFFVRFSPNLHAENIPDTLTLSDGASIDGSNKFYTTSTMGFIDTSAIIIDSDANLVRTLEGMPTAKTSETGSGN